MESSSAVGLFLWSAISAKEVIRSDKLVEEVEEGEKVEEEGRCLQASTACCSRTGWRARATQRNCCLSSWLTRSTASLSWLSRPWCSSATWRRQVSSAPPTGSCLSNFFLNFCSSTTFFFISVLLFRYLLLCCLSIVANDFLNISFLPLTGSTKSTKRELASPLQIASRPLSAWQTRVNQEPTSRLEPVVAAALS